MKRDANGCYSQSSTMVTHKFEVIMSGMPIDILLHDMTFLLLLLDICAGKTWCVAKSGSSDAALTTGLNFACGPGYANCGPIQAGGSCYQPNTLASHATWAYNDYYRRSGNNYWDCYFNGTGVVTITDPSKPFPPCSPLSSLLYANSHCIN